MLMAPRGSSSLPASVEVQFSPDSTLFIMKDQLLSAVLELPVAEEKNQAEHRARRCFWEERPVGHGAACESAPVCWGRRHQALSVLI